MKIYVATYTENGGTRQQKVIEAPNLFQALMSLWPEQMELPLPIVNSIMEVSQ